MHAVRYIRRWLEVTNEVVETFDAVSVTIENRAVDICGRIEYSHPDATRKGRF